MMKTMHKAFFYGKLSDFFLDVNKYNYANKISIKGKYSVTYAFHALKYLTAMNLITFTKSKNRKEYRYTKEGLKLYDLIIQIKNILGICDEKIIKDGGQNGNK